MTSYTLGLRAQDGDGGQELHPCPRCRRTKPTSERRPWLDGAGPARRGAVPGLGAGRRRCPRDRPGGHLRRRRRPLRRDPGLAPVRPRVGPAPRRPRGRRGAGCSPPPAMRWRRWRPSWRRPVRRRRRVGGRCHEHLEPRHVGGVPHPCARLCGAQPGRGRGAALYGCLLLSNAASLLLPGSNLTNLIVLGHLHLSGGRFLGRWRRHGWSRSCSPRAGWLRRARRSPRSVELAARRLGRTRAAPAFDCWRWQSVAAVTLCVLVLRAPALPVAAVGVAAARRRTGRGRASPPGPRRPRASRPRRALRRRRGPRDVGPRLVGARRRPRPPRRVGDRRRRLPRPACVVQQPPRRVAAGGAGSPPALRSAGGARHRAEPLRHGLTGLDPVAPGRAGAGATPVDRQSQSAAVRWPWWRGILALGRDGGALVGVLAARPAPDFLRIPRFSACDPQARTAKVVAVGIAWSSVRARSSTPLQGWGATMAGWVPGLSGRHAGRHRDSGSVGCRSVWPPAPRGRTWAAPHWSRGPGRRQSVSFGPCSTTCPSSARTSAPARRSTMPSWPRSGDGRVMDFGSVIGYGVAGRAVVLVGPPGRWVPNREVHIAFGAARSGRRCGRSSTRPWHPVPTSSTSPASGPNTTPTTTGPSSATPTGTTSKPSATPRSSPPADRLESRSDLPPSDPLATGTG